MQGTMVFTFRLAVGYFIFLPSGFFPMSPVDLVHEKPSTFIVQELSMIFKLLD